MFRNDKAHETMNKPSEPVNPGKINSIMEGTSIEGELRSDSNVRIDGRVKGTLHVRGRLIVGATGTVEGDIHCQSSDIEGTVNGKIMCQELLSLKATAKLTGDIRTKQLAIEPGAVFSGNCDMGGGKAMQEPEPVRLSTAGNTGAKPLDHGNPAARPEPLKVGR
ncbi:MAG: polymer-forming cytoskeletal protein [Flavobacteriales bacterium]|nr:polymer-forming cytoskeletal protein [Flavobacteriales bacterium]MEB2340947.1 polymer-forming cytoskeletal protein [Flavobacteriia bacterium]